MIDPRNPRLVIAVIFAVLGVSAMSVWFIYDETFAELYWREIVGSRVEREFGFRLAYVPTDIPGRDHMYVITQVTPGGRFDQAGIQPGDTFPRWIGYRSRLDLFYGPLAEPASQPLRFRVVNIKHGGFWLRHVREVTVLPVGATPNSALQRTRTAAFLCSKLYHPAVAVRAAEC